MKTKILTIVAILGILGTTIILAKPAIAEEANHYSSLIQKLVDRFGLKADEVQEVFDEHQEERRAEHQVRFEERLAEAVADGTLTEAQKEAILAKKAEMMANHEEMKDLSREERREVMDQHREEMEAWAGENGIDMKEFFGFMGGFRKGHFGPCFGS